MNFGTSIGKFAMPDTLIGRLSTGLECWPKSWSYLGYRGGLSRKGGTVFVYVCVSDAMVLNGDAIRLVDVRAVVTSGKNRENGINDINCFVI